MVILEPWETRHTYTMDKLDHSESWYYTNFVMSCFSKLNLNEFYVPLDSVLQPELGRGLRCPTTPMLSHNRFHFSGLDVWETRYFWDDKRQYPVIGLDPVEARSRLTTILSI